MSVKPIPDGFHSLTPYLVVEDVRNLMKFLKEAFNAQEIHCMDRPDGSVMHAEMRVGDSPIMMGGTMDGFTERTGMLYFYTEDVDAVFKKAVKAGANSIQEPADQFYGDRNAGVEDPSGNIWWIATRKEDVTEEELTARSRAYAKEQGKL